MRFFIVLLLIMPTNSFAQMSSGPKGDMAILYLYQSSIVCAALLNVNPDAIDVSGADHYFDDAARLYSYFHNMPLEESRQHQEGWVELLTGDAAIKAQSLNSTVGARSYLNQYMRKTDANSCSQIRPVANQVLSVYGLQL